MSVARFQARHNDAVGAGSKDSEGIVERTEICPKRVLTRRRMTAASVAAALACTRQSVQAGDRIDKSTLAGKLIMGYQGWFACPDDGAGFGWGHWGICQSRCENSGYAAGRNGTARSGPLRNATQACRRSTNSGVRQPQCYDGRTALYLDAAVWTGWGLALQRFAVELSSPLILRNRDRVLNNVRRAAEDHGRVFLVMYDLSGLLPAEVQLVAQDWRRLLRNRALPVVPRPCTIGGVPCLEFGVSASPRQPLAVHDIEILLDALARASAEFGGVTILGGVPPEWRSLDKTRLGGGLAPARRH